MRQCVFGVFGYFLSARVELLHYCIKCTCQLCDSVDNLIRLQKPIVKVAIVSVRGVYIIAHKLGCNSICTASCCDQYTLVQHEVRRMKSVITMVWQYFISCAHVI